MKTKKNLFLLLAGIMYLTLSACGNTSNFDASADADAESYVASLGYDYYELIELDRNEGVYAHYTYYGYTKERYIHHADRIYLEYQNKDHAARTYSVTQKKYDVLWQFGELIGTWTYKDETRDFYLKIIKMDEKSVTFEYSLKNVEGSSKYDLISVSSNGSEQHAIGAYNDYSLHISDMPVSIWIHSSGISIDGCKLNHSE